MDIKNLLMLSMVKGIGPASIKKKRYQLLQEKSCETFLSSEGKDIEKEDLKLYANEADKIISDCKENGIKIVSILDNNYPLQLTEISDPPSVLFVRGKESLLNQVIAIIGTRKSTVLGNRIAEKVGAYFSERLSICNGLVEGIDEHAIYHNEHIAKNVIGVISGGLIYDKTCSSNHIRVIEDVLNAGGLIISEFYPRQKEDTFSGSKASRIQAGLSHGLILVESKVGGGSTYTLNKFVKLGRPLGVIHYPSSEEYNKSMDFEANRIIVESRQKGLLHLLNKKKMSSLNIGSIIPLESRADYEKLIQEIRNIISHGSINPPIFEYDIN